LPACDALPPTLMLLALLLAELLVLLLTDAPIASPLRGRGEQRSAHARTPTRTHARTPARTHARTRRARTLQRWRRGGPSASGRRSQSRPA
jgi:hypothetical protein